MATELVVGDRAPNLPPVRYLRGGPIPDFESGEIYIVECWATWCGPCVDGIPHLTSLQRAYPNVTILAIAVMEDDFEKVRTFVDGKGEEMGYTVAFEMDDGMSGESWMSRHWLAPAYVRGIPAAFVVDGDRRIAWIGHPARLGEVLPLLADGRFDLKAAADSYLAMLAESLTREKASLARAVNECFKRNDLAGALEAYDVAFAECPALEQHEGLNKLRCLTSTDSAAALDYAKRLLDKFAAQENSLSLYVASALAQDIDIIPEIQRKRAFAQVIIDALQDDAYKASTDDPWTAYRRAESLAIAFTVESRFAEASKQAEIALLHGDNLQLSEEKMDRLRSLLAVNFRAAELLPSIGTKIVCNGDSCVIVDNR